jgi:hypothetical protein
LGVPGAHILVVKKGGNLSSKLRRQICDEAKGGSKDYIASSVYHNYPDTYRWVDKISLLKDKVTDEQYEDLIQRLDLQHNDAIFFSVNDQVLTVFVSKGFY